MVAPKGDFLKLAGLNATDWNERYLKGDTPWDLGGPTPELVRLVSDPRLPRKGRALVPGGGRGHDAVFLAQKGFEVDLVDFAPLALQALLELSHEAKATVYAYRRDFFDLPEAGYHQRAYDLLFEYTFYCAIDPALRDKYARAAAALLKPGGLFVGLFFPLETDKPGPPFRVSREEIERDFAPYFELSFEAPRESINPRAGREILGIFRRK